MNEYLPDLYDYENSMDYYKPEFREDYFEETVSDVWDNCVLESVSSIYNSVYKGLIINILFGFISSVGLSEILFHWLSAICGVYMLVTTIQSTTGLLVVFSSFFVSYILILFVKTFTPKAKQGCYVHSQITPSFVQYGLIILFVSFEYLLLEKQTWLEIRGIMMVFSMKFISLISDVPPIHLPSLSEYCGYIFCCGNILFGPWINFEHYMLQVQLPTKKNIYWFYGIVKALLYSIVFLSISNCWTSYFIEEDSYKILVGYKEALSFRTSHYFVCYLSEAFMLAAGWKDRKQHFDDEYWNFPVTNFVKIEFPTSLSVVVVNWNKPMHEFLKKYIYRKWLPSGKFKAVLLTFVISSLFHGFELKVSTILISLGVFSYLQILVRDHISEAFDICVKVHTCKSCQHKLKRDNAISKFTLLIFSLFTILHLIYLGVLMDETTDEVGIYQKWNELYFYSLWIMFVNFLLVK